jgi:hypothetical protein
VKIAIALFYVSVYAACDSPRISECKVVVCAHVCAQCATCTKDPEGCVQCLAKCEQIR